jgi:hypothetical protein
MRRFFLLLALAVFAPSSIAQAASQSDGSTPAPSSIVHAVTHVPVSTLNQVGAGTVFGNGLFGVIKLTGAPLTSHGKPELLTMNLAWCPHCAANSWALAVALSRFGKLSGLRTIDTGTLFGTKFHGHPAYPHTHGLSFLRAAYNSSLLSLSHVVVQDLGGNPLQNPTRPEQKALRAFDPNGLFPAVDVGGAYGFLNSGYSPGALAHKSWLQIANSLANPNNPTARRIDGLANLFTAAICRATNATPAEVCSSSGVVAAGSARLT